jgi:CRP-like cAMP-binding protein
MASSLFDYPGNQHPAPPPADPEPTADPGMLMLDASTADWAMLGEHAQPHRYRPGEQILGDNDAERCLWVVVTGRVSVAARVSAGSRRQVVDELGPGGVFGELTFLAGEPAHVTVHAATDTTVLRLSLAGFEVLAGKDPTLARYLLFDLARLLAVRLDRLRRLVARQ